MKKRNRRNGLTLIELMVTIAAASILILTVGLILIMAFRSWRVNNAFAELRRDSAFAFSMMTRDVHEASYVGLDDAGTGYLEADSEIVGNPTVTYTQDGDTLEYDDGSGGITLIPKNVQFFDSEKQVAGDGVLLTLELTHAEFGISTTNQVFVNTRN